MTNSAKVTHNLKGDASSGAYAQAGVDTAAGAALVDRIKPFVKSTARKGVMGGLGGFGALFDLKAEGRYQDPLLVSATDGVGTKLKIAFHTGIHDTVGIDLVAMCVNDLVVQGAEPLFFLDYFASGALDVDTAEAVIKGIADGCVQAGCALIGGETAEMPSMYEDGHYDLAGFTVGAVERDSLITGEAIQEGDAVIGLASNGLHTNGFSLVRKIVEAHGGYNQKPDFDADFEMLGEALLVPTRIYVTQILSVLEKHSIKGMAHITGGGLLENIPRVLPDGLAVSLNAANWNMPTVMKWLKRAGDLTDFDMAQTFNCGIGMAVIVSEDESEAVIAAFEAEGERAMRIGSVIKGSGIEINQTDGAWAS